MSTFSSFKASFKGDIVSPSDSDYSCAIARWTVTAESDAAVVAFVKDEVDIALALSYAKANDHSVAIRGGGHGLYQPATESANGDLVIDLSRYMNNVHLDDENQLAYAGGGAIWQQIDVEAIKFGLAGVAGNCHFAGVGGLTLGGGFGWQTAAHGLAIDNLVQAKVVTASGDVVIASETSHPDLFWAIRGGGSNFGVVAEFVFQLHPQRATVYFGRLTYSVEKAQQIIEATKTWWQVAGEKEGMSQIVTIDAKGEASIVIIPFYNGTEEEGRMKFKTFLDIGPDNDTTGEIPYEIVNSGLDLSTNPGQGIYTKCVTRATPDYDAFSVAMERAVEMTKSADNRGILVQTMYEYYPTGKIDSVPRDATAFNRSAPKSHNIILHFSWPGDKDKEIHNGKRRVDISRDLAKELGDVITGGKMASNLGYANFDGDATLVEKHDARSKVAFGDNYPRLQSVKKQYDPECVFNKWFPIVPASA